MKDHQLTLVWKTLKEKYDNNWNNNNSNNNDNDNNSNYSNNDSSSSSSSSTTTNNNHKSLSASTFVWQKFDALIDFEEPGGLACFVHYLQCPRSAFVKGRVSDMDSEGHTSKFRLRIGQWEKRFATDGQIQRPKPAGVPMK